MILKRLFVAIAGIALLVSSGLSVAEEYRPDEFLGLDLSNALLSPKRLGPPAEFAPVPVEANTERSSTAESSAPAGEHAEHKEVPDVVTHHSRPAIRQAGVVQKQAAKPRGAARTKLVRRRGDPLNAQATDTRIQVWPCRAGGICNWKR